MEWWRASMTPITGDFSEPNGSGAIVTSNPSLRILSSSITGTTVTVALKARPLYSSSKKRAILQSCFPKTSYCQNWITSQMGRSPLSVLSEVIGSWISSGNISSFLRPLSILMSEPKSLPVYINSRSTQGMSWLSPFHTDCQKESLTILKMGYRCIDTS